MATVNYKCDTCKRNIELIENSYGITSFGNCIITRNCNGHLYTVKRNPNNIRETLPKYDKNLEDYSPRKLFKAFDKPIPSLTWIVKHNFGKSCVYIVYNANGEIISNDNYTVTNRDGISTFTFDVPTSGIVHILSRNGGMDSMTQTTITERRQASFNDIITFAIPKYITRINSGSVPVEPPSAVPITPTPTPTALPSTPYDTTNRQIRIEIEVTKPNEPTVVCVETLDDILSSKSAWVNWPQLLIRKRKHYNTKTISISKLKVFSNTNNQKLIIPDGTILRITRIDYGTGLLVNIPDRGLLVLLTNPPYTMSDKDVDHIIDCGEMVNSYNEYFHFNELQLYIDATVVEDTFPKIIKYTL